MFIVHHNFLKDKWPLTYIQNSSFIMRAWLIFSFKNGSMQLLFPLAEVSDRLNFSPWLLGCHVRKFALSSKTLFNKICGR